MLKPYDLLENILIDIEKGVREGINLNTLAKKYALSERHLRRLFKFAFNQSLAGYIRSRKMMSSLDELLKADSNLFDIALEYDFEYEQSYRRAFKREFGITPSDLRKRSSIVKVKLPLHLLDENKFSDGLLFGPDIVMIPQFHVMGKLHRIPDADSIVSALQAGNAFFRDERAQINAVINGDVYIGIIRMKNNYMDIVDYMTAVQVEDFKDIPQGFSTYTFEGSLCAKYRYIGQHHYSELNRSIVNSIYEAILKFSRTDNTRYALPDNNIFFEKLDTSLYDGSYCQMEWYFPVVKKNQEMSEKVL